MDKAVNHERISDSMELRRAIRKGVLKGNEVMRKRKEDDMKKAEKKPLDEHKKEILDIARSIKAMTDKRSNPTTPAFEDIFEQDYTNFYQPTDNIFGGATGGYSTDGRFSIQDLQYIGNYRIGIVYNGTWGVAEDATRNWFTFAKPIESDYQKVKPSKHPEIQKLMVRSGFRAQIPLWVKHARQYGTSFLIKYWGKNDKMDTAPPNRPPKRFEAMSPVYMWPFNTWETNGISWDKDVWDFNAGHLGGINNKIKIHRDRVEVLTFYPKPDDWRGLSIVDPVSLSVSSYLNAMIFVVRALAKVGNMVPVMKSGKDSPTKDEIQARLELMESFAANDFLILGKNDEVQFPNTNISRGLYESLEIFKEDIASGWKLSLNYLMSRAQSGGIGSGGALTAERNVLNTFANLQTSISDEILNVWRPYDKDLEDEILLWNLAIQKTDDQRIAEEQATLQTKLMQEQLKQLRMNTKMMKMQIDILDANKDIFGPEGTISEAETISDFKPSRRRLKQMKYFAQIMEAYNKTAHSQILKEKDDKNEKI